MDGDIVQAGPIWADLAVQGAGYTYSLTDQTSWVDDQIVKDSQVSWAVSWVNMDYSQHYGWLRRGPAIRNADGDYKAASFYDLFYERIHYDPAEMVLGQLLNAQVRTFTVWNGFFSNRVLQTVVGQNDEGLVLQTGPLPYTFNALEEKAFSLSVSVQGPPVIDAIYNFTWDHAIHQYRVTGNRVVVLAFPPNPRKGYQEILHFYSSTITSYQGVEQRAALTDTPKIEMVFESQVMDEEMQLFESELWGWQNRSFAVPVWSSYTYLIQAASPGSTTLFVEDTSYREFFPDTVAVIFASPDMYETVEVERVEDGQIRLKKPIQQGWQGRVHVIPCRTMRMSSEVKFQGVVANFKEYGLNMHGDIPEDQGEWADTTTYAGLPVLNIEPDSGLAGTWRRNQEFQDGEYSLPIVVDRSGVGTPDFDYSFTFTERRDQQQFKGFLSKVRGTVMEFWFPTWSPDFTLYMPVQAGEFVIQVVPASHSTMYFDRRGRDHLCIILKDGTQIYRRITSAVMSAQYPTEAIGLEQPLPRIELEQVKLISFLGRCRFVNSQFTFNWQTGDFVTVSTSIRNLTDGIRPT